MSGEIERLVAALNDDPDPLHGDRTPAVEALVAHGLVALPHLLPLLAEGDDLTRLRAQRVLEGVTHAWERGDARAWQALWERNGPYDWRASPALRAESVARWRAWLGGTAP